jgi:hypothetical protein
MTNTPLDKVTNQDPMSPRSSDAPGSQPYPWLATEEQIDWEQRSKGWRSGNASLGQGH